MNTLPLSRVIVDAGFRATPSWQANSVTTSEGYLGPQLKANAATMNDSGRPGSAPASFTGHSYTHTQDVSCRCQKIVSAALPSGSGRLLFYWSRTPEHFPSCGLFNATRKSTTAGMIIKILRHRRGFILDMAMKCVRGGICHSVTYRNIVSSQSPASMVLTCVSRHIYGSLHGAADDIVESLDLAVKCLQWLSKEGRANLADVNQSSRTLLHVSTGILGYQNKLMRASSM
jgi:hypothetical protein